MVDEWDDKAERSDMNRSEWCRHQIQAGQKQIAALDPRTGGESSNSTGLHDAVLDEIPEDEARDTEEIVQSVLKPIEDDVYDLLSDLTDEGEIGYDPRDGGYRKR